MSTAPFKRAKVASDDPDWPGPRPGERFLRRARDAEGEVVTDPVTSQPVLADDVVRAGLRQCDDGRWTVLDGAGHLAWLCWDPLLRLDPTRAPEDGGWLEAALWVARYNPSGAGASQSPNRPPRPAHPPAETRNADP